MSEVYREGKYEQLMMSNGIKLLVIAIAAFFAASALAAPPVAAPTKGYVARSQFTTEIVDREPINRVLVLANDVREVFFFTDLRGLDGQTVTHRWEHNGKVVSTVEFKVKGPRWRVFSRKDLDPFALGKWTVVVTDANGWPIKAVIFKYVDPAQSSDMQEIILPPEGEN